jgi:hypothetical protein
MGPQQIFRAAAGRALVVAAIVVLGGATAAAAPLRASGRESIAVIDLGPDPQNPAVRQQLGEALVGAGLSPALGDGLGDALAGIDTPADQPLLAKALATSQQAFGALDCKATVRSADDALSILAARQAAGMPTPELAKAWAYILLCADRTKDVPTATRAAVQLRAIGGSPDVSPDLLAKYPDVDLTLGVAPIDVDVDTEVPGSQVFVDFQPAGTAPLHVSLAPGEHVIAAANGSRRGSLVGTPVKSQPKLTVAMPDQAGRWSAVAARIAGWHGEVPSVDELAAVLIATHMRAAIVRHGDAIELWGHAGLGEPVRRLDDTPRTLAQAADAGTVLAERVASWSAHAPDSDRPLLVEDRSQDKDKAQHTQWWVYAAVGAAIVAGAIVVGVHHYESDTQTVELHYP